MPAFRLGLHMGNYSLKPSSQTPIQPAACNLPIRVSTNWRKGPSEDLFVIAAPSTVPGEGQATHPSRESRENSCMD